MGYRLESPFDDGVAVVPGDPPDSGPVRPPALMLVNATLALTISLLLVFADRFNDWGHFAGWLLGSLIPVGLVAGYTARDAERRQSPRYSPVVLCDRARTGIAVVSVAVCAAHSFLLAFSLAAR